MPNVRVNISFQDSLLAEIDAEARRESRSRSELLREAARAYLMQKRRWDDLFALGDMVRTARGLKEADVDKAIREVRTKSPQKAVENGKDPS